MPSPIKIEKVTLSGFRAYLTEQTFPLLQGKTHRSLAIFAPNAKGKSSFVDAFEFFFSADGTLGRLGLRRSSMQAGKEALPHIRAEQKGIESAVTMSFRGPQGPFGDKRLVNDSPPASAKTIVDARKLDFIIRGAQLRSFVEHQSPADRYAEVSHWFGLSALVQIQTNLRAVRLNIGQSLEGDAATKERLADLVRTTGGAVQQWDDPAILVWINKNLLTPLDPNVTLAAIDKNDDSYKSIKARKLAEDKETGLLQYEQALTALKRAYVMAPETQKETGVISELYEQLVVLEEARKAEETERSKSASNVFKDVWDAAQKILQVSDLPLDNCPVCETPFDKTSAGSRQKLALHVTMRRDGLAAYSKARAALDTAKRVFLQKVGNARSALSSLVTALTSAGLAEKIDEIKAYAKALEELQDGQALPPVEKAKAEILTQTSILNLAVEERKQRQGDHTWAKALAKLDELIGIKHRLEQVSRVRAELVKLRKNLEDQDSFITTRIKAYCQQVIDALRDRVNEIFRTVHPEADLAPAVRLELDPDGKRPELTLSFDFAENRKAVAPSGYLSDAQVHTLALSLRLAAIEMFNKDVPVIVLDDVITSYDADHRRAVAAMLAEHFANHQIIVVTHDERFFVYLKEQLPSATWDFKRITALDPDYGPRFHDHKIADKLIDDLHAQGKSAANEMRQAEEEWLVQMCRDFATEVRIRDVHKPYSYERAELAQSLGAFLKAKGLIPPAVPGVKNQFLMTLGSGQIENFGSHFQDNPNGFGSIGDEKTRWQEFKAFRERFKCACGGRRFKRPFSMNKPVCIKEKCEQQFTFSGPTVPQSATGT